MNHSISLFGLYGDAANNQGLHSHIVDIFLKCSFSRVFEQRGFAVDNQIDHLVLETSADVSWGQLAKFAFSMVKLSLHFAPNKRSSLFGVVDPFSLFVAKSHADVDQISIAFFLAGGNLDQLDSEGKVPLLEKHIWELSGEFQLILILLSSEEFLGQGVGRGLRALFLFLRNVLSKKGLAPGRSFEHGEGVVGQGIV